MVLTTTPFSRTTWRSPCCLAAIDAALKEQPKFARGHYWAGQIWKFLSDPNQAERAFREAARLDPSNIDAEREVRLISMRKATRNEEVLYFQSL